MIRLSEKLYNKLPAFYKDEDSKIEPSPYPLKRFLQVLGEGFDYMENSIEQFGNIIDIDKCPPEYLSLMVHLLGIEFPFSMDVDTQKRYIKVIPILNRLKGTTDSFEYLARETFGSSAVVDAYKTQYEEGMPPEEWRKVHVRVELDGETTYLLDKEENFRKFAELLRPVNTILVTDLALFYMDKINNRTNVEYIADKYSDSLTDNYIKTALLDTLIKESLAVSDSDTYMAIGVDAIVELIKTTDLETTVKAKDDYDTLQLYLLFIEEDTYTRKSTSDTGTTKFITKANGISNLTGTTKLTTSFKTVNYAPLNYTINH